MKELSIEEKARAYDEAFEFVKNVYDFSNDPEEKKRIEQIFPELKESEDERIRKELLEHCKNQAKPYIQTGNKCPQIQSWIDWLEKQGEQPKKHDVCDYCDQQGGCVSPCPMKLVEKHGEQKPVVSKFKVGDVIRNKWSNHTKKIVRIADDNSVYFLDDGMQGDYISAPISDQENWVLVEQNPAWSEEDEKRLSNAITQLKAASLIIVGDEIDDSITFIKSLKDRVRPKQEWSEEDYNEIETIACHLDNINNKGMAEVLRNIRDKYYHIIPQNRWKPSDLPHWKKSTLPNDNTTGFNSDYFCYKGYNINYKELFEKLPKDD